MEKLILQIFQELKKIKATLGVAESCTGGLLSSQITNISGSSEFFLGAVVSYANSAKEVLLKVDPMLIAQHGAVSREVAEKMAIGVQHQLNCSFALAITGIAGPGGGTPEKPVGTVCFGMAGPNFVLSEKKQFTGSRSEIREQSSEYALKMLLNFLVRGK